MTASTGDRFSQDSADHSVQRDLWILFTFCFVFFCFCCHNSVGVGGGDGGGMCEGQGRGRERKQEAMVAAQTQAQEQLSMKNGQILDGSQGPGGMWVVGEMRLPAACQGKTREEQVCGVGEGSNGVGGVISVQTGSGIRDPVQ